MKMPNGSIYDLFKYYRVIVVTVLGTIIFLFGSDEALSAETACQISTTALKRASQIRGLPIKEETPCSIKDKEQVKDYLIHTINTKIPKERMAAEALIYRAFGFIPRTFNYEEGIVKLYLDQLGGFYDPESNSFTMAAWIPAMLQVTVAVHELTHALQDQYYNLEEFIDIKKYSSDQLLARSALVEGDATAVMIDYTRDLLGQKSIANDSDISALMMQNIVGTSMFASLNDIPESLKLSLLFPYTSGLRFVHHFLKSGGYSKIDTMFRRPPRSTEEILHPDKYLNNDPDFVDVQVGSNLIPDGATVTHADTLGEFAISTLLATFEKDKGRVASAAAGWAGDKVAIYKIDRGVESVVWVTAWDSEEDAQEFFSMYSQVLPKVPGVKIKAEQKMVTLTYIQQ